MQLSLMDAANCPVACALESASEAAAARYVDRAERIGRIPSVTAPREFDTAPRQLEGCEGMEAGHGQAKDESRRAEAAGRR